MNESKEAQPVPQRLVQAALTCFLNDEYHNVTTRQIAAAADTSIAMIRYYFGNKEGLYEEMLRQTLQPLLDILETSLLSSTGGFAEYFSIYYRTMQQNPRFPALILKVLALNQGPGKRFIHQLLERGRTRAREKIELLKAHGQVEQSLAPDMAAFDMQMLIGTRGRERTCREWLALLSNGGFTIQQVVAVRTFARFIVCVPV